MSLVQSTANNFIQSKEGLLNSVNKFQIQLDSLKNNPLDICKRDNKDLQKEIDKIVKSLNTINNILNSISQSISRLNSYTSIIRNITAGLLVFVEILKSLPIPGMFSTVGLSVRMGDILSKISFQLAALLLIITSIDLFLTFAANSLRGAINNINNLLNQLSNISTQIKDCNKKVDLSNLNNSIKNLNNNIDNIDSQLKLTDTNSDEIYKGFTFKIIEEEIVDNSIKLKRRYAVAFNSNNILSLQGSSSFATDKKVLIDELKFIIDKDNLNGYGNNISQSDLIKQFNISNPKDVVANSKIILNSIKETINNDSNLKKLKEKYENIQ